MTAGRYLPLLALACVAAAAPALAADGPTPTSAPAPTDEQARAALAQVCAHVACRTESREIRLNSGDGGTFGVSNERYPYADMEGGVIIYAGEAFVVSLDRNDVSKPRFVRLVPHVGGEGLSGYHAPAPGDPQPAGPALLAFELQQMEGKPDTTLTMRNDTGVPLKFDATMFVPTREGMRTTRTSICGSLPGMMGFESWPHPVIMLVLTNFRRIDAGAMTCD